MLPLDYDYFCFCLFWFGLLWFTIHISSYAPKHAKMYFRLKLSSIDCMLIWGAGGEGGGIRMAMQHRTICAVMCTFISFAFHHLTRKSVNHTLCTILYSNFGIIFSLSLYLFRFWEHFHIPIRIMIFGSEMEETKSSRERLQEKWKFFIS